MPSIENPKENQLASEALMKRIHEAVKCSGYPLQTIVAAELQKQFAVTEEWGYQDRTTQENRTLDIYAFRRLPHELQSGVQVIPSIVLLVECKRSEHPFIFFKSETEQNRPLVGFPRIYGVRGVQLSELSAAGLIKATRSVAPCKLLGLETHPFSIDGPPVCTSFARVGGKPEDGGRHRAVPEPPQKEKEHPKGIVLTGSDAYNSILLPLASSLDFLGGDFYIPRSGEALNRLCPVAAFAVCVLDAPMILSAGGPEALMLSMVPWVRLIRHEKKKAQGFGYHHVDYVVDFVHRFALNAFVEAVLQFGDIVRGRFTEKAGVFQQGRANVNDVNNWEWSDVQPN